MNRETVKSMVALVQDAATDQQAVNLARRWYDVNLSAREVRILRRRLHMHRREETSCAVTVKQTRSA